MLIIYTHAIEQGRDIHEPVERTSRKIYLSYPTSVFINNEDIEFEILNAIADHFNIPFLSIQVVGSAKTGYSYENKREFVPKVSDLDIAIISKKLFNDGLDYAFRQTDGYTNNTVFDLPEDPEKFQYNLLRGYINPLNLPYGDFRRNWLNFFNSLSTQYYNYFKKITGSMYATQYLFEMKQYRAIENYLHDQEEG